MMWFWKVSIRSTSGLAIWPPPVCSENYGMGLPSHVDLKRLWPSRSKLWPFKFQIPNFGVKWARGTLVCIQFWPTSGLARRSLPVGIDSWGMMLSYGVDLLRLRPSRPELSTKNLLNPYFSNFIKCQDCMPSGKCITIPHLEGQKGQLLGFQGFW